MRRCDVAARLLLGEFLKLQARRAGEPRRLSTRWLADAAGLGAATRPSCHVTVGRLVIINAWVNVTHVHD